MSASEHEDVLRCAPSIKGHWEAIAMERNGAQETAL